MAKLRKKKFSGGSQGRWDESFMSDQYKISEQRAKRIRAWEDIEEVPTHYIEFFSEKKGGKTGYYELCLNWDYGKGEAAENDCPACRAGIRTSNYLYGLCIDRVEQKKGVLQIHPIRLTNKCGGDIMKLSEIAYDEEEMPEDWDEDEPPDATDIKYGFDIMISVAKNNGKTEYPVNVANKGMKPLNKEEIRAFRDYADQVDFAALAAKGMTPMAAFEKSLRDKGLLDGGGSGSAASASSKKSTNYDDYDEVPEDDEDDEDPVTAPPKRRKKQPSTKKPASKARKVQSLTDDDEEDGEEDEPVERSLPWDDEDDEDEAPSRTYATPDKDEAPEDDDDEYDDED